MDTESVNARKPYQVVVGFDFSALAERALEEALAICERHSPAELHVITVASPAGLLLQLPGGGDPSPEDQARETVRARIAEILDAYQATNGRVGLDRVAVYVLNSVPAGEPAQLITGLAAAVDADLVVIGTHGRAGLRRLLLGSVAAQVVRDAGTSVYVVRPPDFLKGERVPSIERPLAPGEPHLKHFEHRRTYHYIDKVAPWTSRTMPVG